MNISLIVPEPTIISLGSLQRFPRYGPTIIGTILKNLGYTVRIYDESITPIPSIEDIYNSSDIIAFSAKTAAFKKVKFIVDEIRTLEKTKRCKRKPIILGGEHASMAPEHALSSTDIDYLIRGEGDISFPILLSSLESHEKDIDNIDGIGFKANGNIIIQQNIGNVEKLNDIIPDYSLVVGYNKLNTNFIYSYYRLLKDKKVPYFSFQRTRGCPYCCKFCPTAESLQGRSYRIRSNTNSIEYLLYGIKSSKTRRVIFEDPLAAISNKECIEFFSLLSSKGLNLKATILARVDIYKDTVLLKLMKDAGVKNISLGIESINQKTLDNFNKNQSINDIKKGIDTIHNYGFSITGLFIAGEDADTIEDVLAIEDFIIEYGIEKWRISPLCFIPEKPSQLIPAYRIFRWNELYKYGKDVLDYTNGDFVFYFPKHIRPSELQRAILHLNNSLSSLKSLLNTIRNYGIKKSPFLISERLKMNIANKLIYSNQRLFDEYIDILKDIEKEYYKGCGSHVILLEKKLENRYMTVISKTEAESLSYI